MTQATQLPSQQIHWRKFDNGLTLVAERMDWLESAAFTLMLPAGCAYDPPDQLGLANFVCEMAQRGCGGRDSRRFVEDLENLGVDRGASVGNSHTTYGGAMPAENLFATLGLYADLVLRPLLPDEQLEEARQVCLNEIYSVRDDFAHQTMLELRRRTYPDPYGRASYGDESAVESISLDDVRRFFERRYNPRGAILGVAGKIDWIELCEAVEGRFGDWREQHESPLTESPPLDGDAHLQRDSNQTHIGISYPNVPYGHPDYYQSRGAIGVLSDGMSSRLFSEVREKRGLCYSVHATCHSLRGHGSVMCYAGTTPERAQETLDVTLDELRKLAKGVAAEELDRLKARIKTALIMQQESSHSRSGALALDWHYLGRVQTLIEIREIINGLTCDTINRYLADHPPAGFRVVTLGPAPLNVGAARG